MSAAHQLLPLTSDFLFACAGLGCIYLLMASVVILRFSHRPMPLRGPAPPVTVLKPLHGAEPGLPDRLASFCRQDYEGPVQVVCGIGAPSDAAAAAVETVKANDPQAPITLVVDRREHGSNRKMSNLVNMLPEARHDIIVISDSDIEVGSSYLSGVISELRKPDIGGVTCIYHGVAGPGRWSRLNALAINSHFLPNAIVALSFHLARPCFGSTIALRRDTLARLGGFRNFTDCLADDFAIGDSLRALGFAVAVPPFSVGHLCFHDRLQSMLAHELRVAKTIRNISPVGYLGTLITHPFPLAMIAVLLGRDHAVELAGLALGCRIVVCWAVDHSFQLPSQSYWQIPLRDCLSFVVFVASFFGSTVTWRGRTYRISSDGRLFAEQESSRP